MSATSRVSAFQNVFDLLDYEPPMSPAALAAIEETEARIGRRLPAGLRDWYAREGVVETGPPVGQWNVPDRGPWFLLPGPVRHRPATWTEQLWYNFVGTHDCRYATPDSLTAVLAQIDGRVSGGALRAGYARVLVESYDELGMMVEWARSDDPPVWIDDGSPDPARWRRAADRFSELVFQSFAIGYLSRDSPLACTPLEPEDWPDEGEPPDPPPPPPKPYGNGLFLRAPDEPFAPAVIDSLGDSVGTPQTAGRPDGATTYTFRPEGGLVRVTADPPGVAGGRAAWWVHAQTPERLEALARLLGSPGAPGERLTSATRAADGVLERVKGAGRTGRRT